MELNKTTGYFHIALMHGLNGFMVANEIHGRIIESGLYDSTQTINVCILGDEFQANQINNYVFSNFSKYNIRYFSDNINLYEWPTLSTIKSDCLTCNNDIWYIHTKGASNCRPDVPARIQHNIRCWRNIMCYETIRKHENCKKLLTEYDAVGPFYVEPTHYFAGNFWWAKASHIKNLKEPFGTRNEAEGWIGTCPTAKFYDLRPLPANDLDLYDFSNKYGEKGVFYNLPGSI